MSKSDDWIDERLRKAKHDHALVTDEIVTKVRDLIKGQLCERLLSSKELETTAKVLIADSLIANTSKLECK